MVVPVAGVALDAEHASCRSTRRARRAPRRASWRSRACRATTIVARVEAGPAAAALAQPQPVGRPACRCGVRSRSWRPVKSSTSTRWSGDREHDLEPVERRSRRAPVLVSVCRDPQRAAGQRLELGDQGEPGGLVVGVEDAAAVVDVLERRGTRTGRRPVPGPAGRPAGGRAGAAGCSGRGRARRAAAARARGRRRTRRDDVAGRRLAQPGHQRQRAVDATSETRCEARSVRRGGTASDVLSGGRGRADARAARLPGRPTQVCGCGQPLTAPAVRPRTKNRCRDRNTMIGTIMARKPPAVISSQPWPSWPLQVGQRRR